MSQSFPNITGEDYIDVGILALQDRDNATLTWFSGDSAPENPFENLVWNDTEDKCVKWHHNSSWETIIDYGKTYITVPNLQASYQLLNSNLTNYSSVNVSGTGFISNQWIPLSNFFINKLWNGFNNNIGLGNLAYKSSLTSSEIGDKSIAENKLTTNIVTDPVFKVGDVIPSFNSGNKSGCVKLSKSSGIIYTVGATSSNSTYKGDVYKKLFQFIWTNVFVSIYTSTGVKSSKSNKGWEDDWKNNKRIELPHIDLPEDNAPKEQKITRSGGGIITISKSGYYEITLIGAGGGSGAMGAGTGGHQAACSGAGGAGYKGEILLNANDKISYIIGKGGARGPEQSDHGWPGSKGGAGGDSSIKLNNANLLTCTGGGGGQAWWRYSWIAPSGGVVTVHQNNKFSNVTSKNGNDGVGTSGRNTVSANGPFNTDYGKAGSAWADSSYHSHTEDGYDGYLSIKFLAPKEYGTTNSTIKTGLDNLYNSITYFMKY